MTDPQPRGLPQARPHGVGKGSLQSQSHPASPLILTSRTSQEAPGREVVGQPHGRPPGLGAPAPMERSRLTWGPLSTCRFGQAAHLCPLSTAKAPSHWSLERVSVLRDTCYRPGATGISGDHPSTLSSSQAEGPGHWEGRCSPRGAAHNV